MKTSVYLDPDDKRSLTALARSSCVSEAELIRRGVRFVLRQAGRPRPHAGFAVMTDSRSARDTDHLLEEHGFGRL